MKEIYSHSWESIGSDERIARFPSKIGEKRQISVHISSWIGISIGAKHYNVRVEEENNAWWSESENAWMELSCDAERFGYSLDAKVLNEAEAIKCAKFFVKMIAGKTLKNHYVVWDGVGKPSWSKNGNY